MTSLVPSGHFALPHALVVLPSALFPVPSALFALPSSVLGMPSSAHPLPSALFAVPSGKKIPWVRVRYFGVIAGRCGGAVAASGTLPGFGGYLHNRHKANIHNK